MKLDSQQKKFRNERAKDLVELATVFEKVDIPCTYKLREAASVLTDFNRTRKIDENDNTDYSFWGYKIDSIDIPFPEPPRHIKPEKLYPVSANISIDVIASSHSWGSICDPLKKLEFNIEISGYGNEKMHRICYHIDKHLESKSEEPHPMYHFHFGGNKMNFDDIGSTVFLDIPRLIFYPVDIILGMDFVLSNFFPIYWNKLLQESVYNSLVQEYYNALVKPFAHSLASKWTPYDHHSIDWNPHLIFPQLGSI